MNETKVDVKKKKTLNEMGENVLNAKRIVWNVG